MQSCRNLYHNDLHLLAVYTASFRSDTFRVSRAATHTVGMAVSPPPGQVPAKMAEDGEGAALECLA
jgi:hypothetical protein